MTLFEPRVQRHANKVDSNNRAMAQLAKAVAARLRQRGLNEADISAFLVKVIAPEEAEGSRAPDKSGA